MTSLEALISAPPPNPLHGRLPSPQQAPRLRLASELWALCLVCTKDTSHRSSGGLDPPLHPTRRPGAGSAPLPSGARAARSRPPPRSSHGRAHQLLS